MKKLLCFVLALAMIFGCLSMVTFVQAEGTEYAGVKVHNFNSSTDQNGIAFFNVMDGVTIDGDNATITLKVNYTNPSQQRVWLTIKPCDYAQWVGTGGDFYKPYDATGTTSYGWVSNGDEVELSATFSASAVNNDLALYIMVGVEGGAALSSDAEFVFSSNANIIPSENKVQSGYWVYGCYMVPVSADVTPLTAEQMPGYVAPAVDYAGVKIAFTDVILGGTANYFYVYNVANTATDNGDGTATLKVRFYNEGANAIWIEGIQVIDNGTGSIITTYDAAWVQANSNQWTEFNINIPTNAVHDNLCYRFSFSAVSLINLIFDAPGSAAGGDVSSRMWFQNCAGTLSAVLAEQMPGYVAPTEEPTPVVTPEPTPVIEYAGVKLNLATSTTNNKFYFYNVTEGIDISGDVASFTFKAYNTMCSDRLWAIVKLWNNNGWVEIPTTSGGGDANAYELAQGTSHEFTVTFPAQYVNNDLIILFTITSLAPFAENTSFVVSSSADIILGENKLQGGLFINGCTGSAENLTKDQMPVEATPTPTPTPTPAPVGGKVELTQTDNAIAHVPGSYVTDAMVEGTVVTVKTPIYNPNNHTVTVYAQLMKEWDANVQLAFVAVEIPANTKKTVTLSCDLAGANVTKEQINIRYSFVAGFEVGDVIYFTMENAAESFLTAEWYVPCGAYATVIELPALDEAVEATPEPTPEPTPTPAPVGVKVDINSEIGDGKSIYVQNVNGATFTDANVVDGFVTATTEIYNPNNHDVTFGVQLQKNWADFDPVVYAQVVIPANSKKTVTLTVDRNAVTYAEEICIRYSFAEGIVVGDSFYFTVANAATGFYDATNWWVQYTGDSSPASSVTELPALEEAIVNKIEGAQLQLGSSLSVIYYATVDNNFINSGNDIILAVTRNEKTVYITGTKVDTNMYSFTYTGINAQCMADTIDAVLICGEDMLDSYADYSVKQYAINQYTNGANLKLDKLLNDMLVYGAEAQKTSGYMIDELATDDVAWIQVSSYVAPNSFVANNEIVELNDAANKVTTVGLNISNVNRIYFKVALTEGAQIKVYRNGVEVDYTVDGATVYTEAIYATDFDAVYTIEIVYDGNVVSRVNYSVNNYIISMHGHNKVGAITTALNNYGQSAVAYRA